MSKKILLTISLLFIIIISGIIRYLTGYKTISDTIIIILGLSSIFLGIYSFNQSKYNNNAELPLSTKLLPYFSFVCLAIGIISCCHFVVFTLNNAQGMGNISFLGGEAQLSHNQSFHLNEIDYFRNKKYAFQKLGMGIRVAIIYIFFYIISVIRFNQKN